VYYLTVEGAVAYLPAAWTDVGPKDPFVAAAGGRAIARVEDLLELAKVAAVAVKRNPPQM